tara:strand:+ start:1981 stop:2205 length:225 start_codon:yes stop_codon:yes gene_type:complete
MRLHELTERGRGADGAYELKKRKTDLSSPQNIQKLQKMAKSMKPKTTKDYTSSAPRNYNMSITKNDPTGAMGRS